MADVRPISPADRHSQVGPIELWQMKRAFQIQFLKDAGLKPEHHLVDVGCGTLRGGIPIIAYLDDGHYCGIEVRAEMLEEGRKEIQEAGLDGKGAQLVHVGEVGNSSGAADLSGLELDRRFDFIWAFSVLIHMSDETLDACLQFAQKHLAPAGVFYANVSIGDQPWTGRWKRFPFVCRTREFYEDAIARHGLHLHDLGPLSSLGHVSGRATSDATRMLMLELADGAGKSAT